MHPLDIQYFSSKLVSLSLVPHLWQTLVCNKSTVKKCVSFYWFWQEPWFYKALSTSSWRHKVCVWNWRILQCWAVDGAFSELSHPWRRNRFDILCYTIPSYYWYRMSSLPKVDHPIRHSKTNAFYGLIILKNSL